MILGAEHGHPLRVEVEGRNKQAVVDELAEIFGEREAV
jgi:phosphotransferase system HPr-like phosphotransfer protein